MASTALSLVFVSILNIQFIHTGNTVRNGPQSLGGDVKYRFLYQLYDSVRESDPSLVNTDMTTYFDLHTAESWG